MRIDSPTIVGATLLFTITVLFVSFVLTKIKPLYVQKSDKTVHVGKAIGIACAISFVFTVIMTYISIKVDKQNLLKAKKSVRL
jgi:succinate-acetate transporter protein